MRFFVILGLLLLPCLPCAARGGKKKSSLNDDAPWSASLERRKLADDVAPGFFAARASESVPGPLEALACAFRDTQLALVDLDGNGRIDDTGGDGWRLANHPRPVLLPFEGSVVIGAQRIAVGVSEDGKQARFQPIPLAAKESDVQAVELVNRLRLRCGLAPFSIDTGLSDDCAKHVRYMELNKHYDHSEQKGKPGYTAEGARAGGFSALDSRHTPEESIGRWWGSLFHRRHLIHPDVFDCGIASSTRFVALDCAQNRRPRRWKWPVLSPGPDAREVPVAHAPEADRPYADEGALGNPVVLLFNRGARPSQVKATLRPVKTGRRRRTRKKRAEKLGEPVPSLLSWPGNPARARTPDNKDCICLMPRAVLRHETTYVFDIQYELEGKRFETSWRFTTDSKRKKKRRRR